MPAKDPDGFYFNMLTLDDLRNICDVHAAAGGFLSPSTSPELRDLGKQYHRSPGAINLTYRRLVDAANGVRTPNTPGGSLDKLTAGDYQFIFRGNIPTVATSRSRRKPGEAIETARVNGEALLSKLDNQMNVLGTVSGKLDRFLCEQEKQSRTLREIVFVMREAWNVRVDFPDIDDIFGD